MKCPGQGCTDKKLNPMPGNELCVACIRKHPEQFQLMVVEEDGVSK